jgi:small subunit ribosomal protein S13
LARVAGVDLPKNKRMETALTYIFGIGLSSAKKILKRTGVDPDKRVKDLSHDEVSKIREVIDHEYKVEGELRKEVAMNIKRLIDVGCYRGMRHIQGLPVRGQRTRTNARSRKGPKKTVAGRGKKKGAKK